MSKFTNQDFERQFCGHITLTVPVLLENGSEAELPISFSPGRIPTLEDIEMGLQALEGKIAEGVLPGVKALVLYDLETYSKELEKEDQLRRELANKLIIDPPESIQ